MTTIALITPDEHFGEIGKVPASISVQRCWNEEYLRIDPAKVVAAMVDLGADVVSLGPRLPLEVLLEIAETFDRERPDICVMLVASPTPDLWERALRAGVRDIVQPGASVEEVSRALARAVATVKRRRAGYTPSAAEPAPSCSSRVITVLSPKGGAGKTTVATNLAVGLAGAMPGQVALVDLDVHFGDVPSALGLQPEHTLTDVVHSSGPADSTMLKVLMTCHSSSLYVMSSPDAPADGDEVTSEHAAYVVQALASELAIVIVDTPGGLDELTLAAVDVSTDLLFVCGLDVASARALRKELHVLDRLGWTSQRRHLVLNRSDPRIGLAASDIETLLGLTADVVLPLERAVTISMNEGAALIETDPRAPISRQLGMLVERFRPIAAGTTAAPPGGGFRRFRKEGR
jgi:pilus assembly protein CpaE